MKLTLVCTIWSFETDKTSLVELSFRRLEKMWSHLCWHKHMCDVRNYSRCSTECRTGCCSFGCWCSWACSQPLKLQGTYIWIPEKNVNVHTATSRFPAAMVFSFGFMRSVGTYYPMPSNSGYLNFMRSRMFFLPFLPLHFPSHRFL